jgi:hypothetical protein
MLPQLKIFFFIVTSIVFGVNTKKKTSRKGKDKKYERKYRKESFEGGVKGEGRKEWCIVQIVQTGV